MSEDTVPAETRRRRFFGAAEILMLGILLVVAGLVYGFLELGGEVREGETVAFDSAVLGLFQTPGSPRDPIGPPWVEEMARDITALGSFAWLGLLVFGVVLYLALAKKRGAAALVTVAVLGGTAISTLLKIGYDRPRPEFTDTVRVFTASFPSGHAMLSAVTYLTLGALLARLSAGLGMRLFFVGVALFLTVIVGISRVYLGVHYPTDVLAGWAVGLAWALFCSGLALWLQRRGELAQPTRP